MTNQHALAFSNTNPTAFQFGDHSVRIIIIGEEPWFVAVDICNALGYSNSRAAVADHLDDDERSTVANSDSRNGGGKLTIINESGLYALVLRSRKPEARKFAKWVTGEVLPSIRKTGAYGTPKIDPAALLLEGQSTPTLPIPEAVQRAIDLRTWELTREAHQLIHQHLRRRAAYHSEGGYPVRRVDEAKALAAIARGDLGDALTHEWQEKMRIAMSHAKLYAHECKRFLDEAAIVDQGMVSAGLIASRSPAR